jgi:putative DNA primase/helicase
MLMGVDFYINNTKNIMARLVPFKNGVLDLNTIKLLNHDPSYYFTYSLNINYNPSAKIEKSMLDFLISITNNNLYALKIIRSFIKCLLIKDNQYQVALYLYGPGGTGKSTFEKVLTSLVGNKNATVLNLQDLNKQFALSKVVDKSLVLFSDVNFYTGDPSKLRLLISGDLMNAEIKYKDSFDIQPNCLVVLSSNML